MVGVGRSAKNTNSAGTAVKKSSQIQSVDASASAIPERVSVAIAEIAEKAVASGAGCVPSHSTPMPNAAANA